MCMERGSLYQLCADIGAWAYLDGSRTSAMREMQVRRVYYSFSYPSLVDTTVM